MLAWLPIVSWAAGALAATLVATCKSPAQWFWAGVFFMGSVLFAIVVEERTDKCK